MHARGGGSGVNERREERAAARITIITIFVHGVRITARRREINYRAGSGMRKRGNWTPRARSLFSRACGDVYSYERVYMCRRGEVGAWEVEEEWGKINMLINT